MRLLLDTHAALWWFLGDPAMSPAARRAITGENAKVWISAVSAWEIAIKHHLGKLPQAAGLAERLEDMVRAEGFHQLDVTFGHTKTAGLLPIRHKDPFDRLLIAQSQIEAMTLVSNEALFDEFAVVRLW